MMSSCLPKPVPDAKCGVRGADDKGLKFPAFRIPISRSAGYRFGTTRTRHPGPFAWESSGRMAKISGGV